MVETYSREMEEFKRRMADSLGYDFHDCISTYHRVFDLCNYLWIYLWVPNRVRFFGKLAISLEGHC